MKIEFLINDPTIYEFWRPIPTSEKVPEFVKNLPEVKEYYETSEKIIDNVKSCLPFMDLLTAGYLLPVCVEFTLNTTVKNFSETLILESARVKDLDNPDIKTAKLAAVFDRSSCPMDTQDRPKHFFKYTTDWSIRTPPGYSCLVMQPQFASDKNYKLFSAIIDTDTYNMPIPISGYIKTKNEVRFRPGDYVLQVIPFKRDDWNMDVKIEQPVNKSKFFIYNVYRKLFHKSKQFK